MEESSYKDGELIPLLVSADTKIQTGDIVLCSGEGLATTSATGVRVAGISVDDVDNTNGEAGAQRVLVRRGKAYLLHNSSSSPITGADLFNTVYYESRQTVSRTGSKAAGKVVQIEEDGTKVWVVVG